MFTQIVLYGAVVLLALWLVFLARYEHRGALLQLVYLIRFPLLFGLLVLVLPVASVFVLTNMLGNLFVLDTVAGIALVVWMAFLVAWMVLYTLTLLVRSIHRTYPDLQPVIDDIRRRLSGAWYGQYRTRLFAILTLPTLAVIITSSRANHWSLPAIGIPLGIVAAWLFYRVLMAVRPWVIRRLNPIRVWMQGMVDRLPSTLREGFEDEYEDFRHDAALVFLVLSGSVYLAGAWLFSPNRPWDEALNIPAVFYILLHILTLGLLLPAIANILDRFRVPTSLVLLLTIMVVSGLFDTGHYYTVTPIDQSEVQTVSEPADPDAVFSARRAHQVTDAPPSVPAEELPYVIVMASGGGIRAAVWTAQVLTGLQARLGAPFVDGIMLISAVSGGSLGTMYYVDGFSPRQADAPLAHLPSQPEEIVQMAGASTLRPVGWGLAYPDLWRLFFWVPGLRWPRHVDRGWAMESAWDARLQALASDAGRPLGRGPAGMRMLSEWQESVNAGWRPAVIFNATEVESGARFLFSSADIETTDTARNFTDAFPNYDLPVATAVRMSATFPYASPLARADLPNDDNYHLADGGYFDNDGVVTALEWLESNLSGSEERPRKIVLIQIIAAERGVKEDACGPTTVAAQPEVRMADDRASSQAARADEQAWLYKVAGPLFALMSVRDTSQLQRGQSEIARFIDLYSAKYPEIEFSHCVFDLQGDNTLSWQLSPNAYQRILDHWSYPDIQARVAALETFLAR